MNSYIKLAVINSLLLVLSGCLAGPTKSEYADLATVGLKYTSSINEVVNLAAAMQVDAGSYALIKQGILEKKSSALELTDNSTDNEKQVIANELLGRMADKVVTRNKSDLQFLSVLADYKKFNNMVGGYFERVSKIAGTAESTEHIKQLNTSVDGVFKFIDTITGVKHLKLEEEAKKGLDGIASYLDNRKIEGVLENRLNADSPKIQAALEVQKRMMSTLSDRINEQQTSIAKFKRDKLLLADLVKPAELLGDPERSAKLILNRRQWLNTETDLAKIALASSLATKLGDALELLVNGDHKHLVSLTNLVSKLEELDMAVKKLNK